MMKIISNRVGASRVAASDGGKTSVSSDATSVTLHIVPTTAPADGKATMRATAFVAMGDGSLAPDGTQVTFSASNGATADPSQVATAHGIAATSITSTTAGDSSVKATSGGVESDPVPVQFTAVSSDVKSVALHIDPTTAPADGKTTMQVTASVAMSGGSLAPDGTQVTFSASNGATADPSSAPTTGGSATARITSTTVGESNVTATSDGVTSSPVPVQFTALPLTVQAVDLMIVAPQAAPADGNTAVTGTAKVKMSDGTPAPDGTEVIFTPSNGATAYPAAAYTSGGEATTRIMSNTEGASSVTATSGGVTSHAAMSMFTSVSTSVQSVSLMIDPTTVPADGQTAIMCLFAVQMGDGPARDGTQVTFTASNGATVTPTLAYTSGGRGLATALITSETVGESSVTAGSGGLTTGPAVVTFTSPVGR